MAPPAAMWLSDRHTSQTSLAQQSALLSTPAPLTGASHSMPMASKRDSASAGSRPLARYSRCRVVHRASSRAVMPPRAPQSEPSQLKGCWFSLCQMIQSTSCTRAGGDAQGTCFAIALHCPINSVWAVFGQHHQARLRVQTHIAQHRFEARPVGLQSSWTPAASSKDLTQSCTRATAHLVEAMLPLFSHLCHLAKRKIHGLQNAQPLLTAARQQARHVSKAAHRAAGKAAYEQMSKTAAREQARASLEHAAGLI